MRRAKRPNYCGKIFHAEGRHDTFGLSFGILIAVGASHVNHFHSLFTPLACQPFLYGFLKQWRRASSIFFTLEPRWTAPTTLPHESHHQLLALHFFCSIKVINSSPHPLEAFPEHHIRNMMHSLLISLNDLHGSSCDGAKWKMMKKLARETKIFTVIGVES